MKEATLEQVSSQSDMLDETPVKSLPQTGKLVIPYSIDNGKLTLDLGEITDIFLKVKDPAMGLQISSNGNLFLDSLKSLILTSNWATDENRNLDKVLINPTFPDTDIPVPREIMNEFIKDFHAYLKHKEKEKTCSVLEHSCKCGESKCQQ